MGKWYVVKSVSGVTVATDEAAVKPAPAEEPEDRPGSTATGKLKPTPSVKGNRSGGRTRRVKRY